MSKASGLVLIALGVGVAFYVVPSVTEDAEQATQDTVVSKEFPPAAVVKTAARSDEIIPPVPKPAVRPVKTEVKAEARPETRADQKAAPAIGGKTTTVVTIAQHVANPTDQAGKQQRVAALLPGDRVGLTRELQRELKRVGCYDGDVNGIWTPLSRRAMKAFTDRVNASLPIDEPDYILLTLVQGRTDRACGAPCPAGEGLSGDGRCLPQAIVARAAKKGVPAPEVVAGARKTEDRPTSAVAGWSAATTTTTDQAAVTEGRMALAGPRKDAVPARAAPGGGAPTRAAVTVDPAEEQTARRERPPRPAKVSVQNRAPRYVTAPHRKFGPWFFRQQDTWNN